MTRHSVSLSLSLSLALSLSPPLPSLALALALVRALARERKRFLSLVRSLALFLARSRSRFLLCSLSLALSLLRALSRALWAFICAGCREDAPPAAGRRCGYSAPGTVAAAHGQMPMCSSCICSELASPAEEGGAGAEKQRNKGISLMHWGDVK